MDKVHVTLQIPRDVAAQLTASREGELDQTIALELGLALFASGRITPSQTRRLIGLSEEEFGKLLLSRRLPWRYDVREPEVLGEVQVSLR